MHEHDTYEHNPGDHEDPLAAPTWMIGFLGTVLLIIVVLGVTALYYGAAGDEVVVKLIEGQPGELIDLRAEQLVQLELTQWEDRPPEIDGEPREKVLVIPIEDAMQIVASELSAGARR